MEHGLINFLKNHKHKRAFNQGVLAKPVFDQPYWVHHQAAIWLFRLHRRCVLCQLHHLDYQMGRMNFICADCQANIATQVSYFNIHLNIGKDFPTNKDRLTAQQTPKRQHIRAYPVSYYQYPVNQLIKKFKDHENSQSLLALYALIAHLPKPDYCHAGNTVILPIPTTQERMRQRGFDPVAILAKFLAWHWQLPLWQGVARHDGKRHQRGLTRHERLVNTQTDFYLCQQIPNRQIIIFDDVITTGATVAAVANLLIRHRQDIRLIAICMAHGSADFGFDTHDR